MIDTRYLKIGGCMKKGTKIAIGVGSALAAGAATAGILYVKNKKNNKKDQTKVINKDEKKVK